MSFERLILSHLITDEDYTRSTIPFLKQEYFRKGSPELLTFNIISDFFNKYNALPTKEALLIELDNIENLGESLHKETDECIRNLSHDEQTEKKFIFDETEKFCQEKAIHNALLKSIEIINEPSKGLKNSIPKILQDALAVSFDTSIGHDYFEDAGKRYDYYHEVQKLLRFDIDILNVITRGGVVPESLFLLMAPTGLGKSLALCHFAASHLMQSKNCLYFTMEMSEFQIAQRIEHNLMGVREEELKEMTRETYNRRLAKVREKSTGKLVVKGFPSGAASASHFRYVIEEMKIKKKIDVDVIYVDYLNICASSRIKRGNLGGSYEYVKNIAEEIRGLGQEYKIPVFSATQTNRSGMNSSDLDFEHMSESSGMAFTADYIIGMSHTEDLKKMGQIMFKQIKNRYGDTNKFERFVVGVDRSRMRLFNVEQEAQDDVMKPNDDDSPVMDQTVFGEQDNERSKPRSKKSKFAGFK